MGGKEYVSSGLVPIHLVAGHQAVDPVTGIPSDVVGLDVPGGTGAAAGPFVVLEESGPPEFEKNLASLRGGDAVQTFVVASEPPTQSDAFGSFDADAD